MPDLTGKVAIVTGGGQGIGKGIAKLLLEEGMRVVLAEVDAEAGQEAAGELEAFGSVLFQQTDVADEAQVARLVEATLSRFGHLDALINNAGIAHPDTGPLEALELGDWNRRLAVNLTGPFFVQQARGAGAAQQPGGYRQYRLYPRLAIGAQQRGLRRQQRRAGGADPCAGGEFRAADPR